MLQVVVTFPAGDAHPLDRPQFDRIIESLEDYASFQGRPMAFLTHPIHARTGTIKADLNPVPHEPYLTVGETERWLGELKNLVHSRGDFYDMHIVVRKRGVVAQEGSIGLIHEGDLLASYVSVAVSATAAPAATSLSVPAAVEVIGPGPTFQVA